MELVRFFGFVVLFAIKSTFAKMPVQIESELDTPSDNVDSGIKSDEIMEIEDLNDCVEYKSQPGRYRIGGQTKPSTCGLYIIGPVDSQVVIRFEEFNVGCENRGTVEIVDGYAHGNTIFPPVEDQLTGPLRNQVFCGTKQPSNLFQSTGNMALIQHRLTQPNDGFVVHISFVENPEPCNSVLLFEEGRFLLQNHGKRVNCSVLMLFPQKITLQYVSVGYKSKAMFPARNGKSGLQGSGTRKFDRADRVEILGGNSSSLKNMVNFKSVSGYNKELLLQQDVNCDSVMVRLISSGLFLNVLEVEHEVLNTHPGPLQSHSCKRRSSRD